MAENQNPKIHGSNFGIGNVEGDISAGTVGGNVHATAEKFEVVINKQQNLSEAVAEVQQILEQLSQTYPMETVSEKTVAAAEVIKKIDANPTFKNRLINAVKEGGLAGLEKALDNVVGATIVAAIKGWQENE